MSCSPPPFPLSLGSTALVDTVSYCRSLVSTLIYKPFISLSLAVD